MDKLLVVIFGAFISFAVYGATDFVCVSDCQNRGYQYQLCVNRCSYGGATNGGASGGYWSGYFQGLQGVQAIEQIKQQQLNNQQQEMRNQMIRNADAACKKGNQQACNDVRVMLFGK